jgi:hypothetical protein
MTFRDSRLKIDRANEHIAEIKNRIDFVTGPDGQTSRVEIHSEARVKSVHYRLTRLGDLPKIACVIGDAIHNLKTALDYAWFQAVNVVTPSNTLRPKFPIYPSIDQLENALTKSGIDTASPRLFNLILRDVKPYDGGNFYLRPLHKMDIMDKHELLIPATNYGSVSGLKVKNQHGSVTGGTWGGELPEEFHIDFTDDIEIQDEGSVPFQIVFKEGPMKLMPVLGSLQDASATVLGIVKLMEEVI